jgi:hypothetical protein
MSKGKGRESWPDNNARGKIEEKEGEYVIGEGERPKQIRQA